MPNKVIQGSGKVKRIHVESADNTCYARFTLEGQADIYRFSTTDTDLRNKLELTSPGDVISFECEEAGWILKSNHLCSFTNVTLDAELKPGI
jgi:hypothetical protein